MNDFLVKCTLIQNEIINMLPACWRSFQITWIMKVSKQYCWNQCIYFVLIKYYASISTLDLLSTKRLVCNLLAIRRLQQFILKSLPCIVRLYDNLYLKHTQFSTPKQSEKLIFKHLYLVTRLAVYERLERWFLAGGCLLNYVLNSPLHMWIS